MKVFQISAAVAFLATLAQAAPTPDSTSSVQVTVVFTGAAASFTQVFPADNELQKITNTLSVDFIYNEGQGGATCEFWGIDGSDVTVAPGATATVGPPQTQVSGKCWI